MNSIRIDAVREGHKNSRKDRVLSAVFMDLNSSSSVPEVFVEHSFVQSNIARNYVLGQQQKLGTKFVIVACALLLISLMNFIY